MPTSRREFLFHGSLALAGAVCVLGDSIQLRADPLGRPAGLQLYTVGEQLHQDFAGTLAQIAAIGYKEIETAGFYDRPAAELKTAFSNAGLSCRSVHITAYHDPLEKTLEIANALGAKYVVSSVLPKRIEDAVLNNGKADVKVFFSMLDSLRFDDYKLVTEHCNKMGEQIKKAGLQFAYHNHNWEFKSFDGKTGYSEILRATDPQLVKFELDCGWMVSAGHDPVAYLTKYPDRYRMLHIKDFKLPGKPSFTVDPSSRPEATELGHGGIDYRPIFAAAKKSEVEWYFVEQEPPFKEMPAMEAIKVNYQYLHNLSA